MKVFEKSLLADDNMGLSQKDNSITLPEAEIYKIKYEDKYGRQLLAAGEEQKVMRTLAKAGYKINIER
jgi:hypothetical protein